MAVPVEEGRLIANTFNFRVTLRSHGATSGNTALGGGGFQECSGLEIEMESEEVKEGGRNDGTVRLVGRGKYTTLILKRGMFYPEGGKVTPEFWTWLQDIVSMTKPIVRYDGMIEAMDKPEGRALATWSFVRGLPIKVKGPELNAKTGEVAIEELHIAHEGLRLEIA